MTHKITTYEEMMQAIANGYPVSIASDQQLEKNPTPGWRRVMRYYLENQRSRDLKLSLGEISDGSD